jgi:hypothetical protein
MFAENARDAAVVRIKLARKGRLAPTQVVAFGPGELPGVVEIQDAAC